MRRTLILSAFLMLLALPALGKDKKVQDCTYFNTRMVMSKSSGAVGHVLSGDVGKNSAICHYTIRFFLEGRLFVVKDMYDYELEWAPEKSTEEEKAATRAQGHGYDYVPRPSAAVRPPEDFGYR